MYHFAVFLLFVRLAWSLPQNGTCRCFPGLSCWPSDDAWASLNATVGGRLIKNTPLAAVCHDPTYQSQSCNNLTTEWPIPDIHYTLPPSPWAPLFQEQSCTPFSAENATCDPTHYPSYDVEASGAADIVSTLAFARDNNIRLVIRSAGHDLMGKSTGAGSLAVWTHTLKEIQLLPSYSSSYYNGTAVKVGAGVQGDEVLVAAQAHGQRVLSGSCLGVTPAGGYGQGGGHSMLATKYGLAADNILEWEAVTANGSIITATPTAHSDLYWALSGGGGGTYAVVVSMTYQTFADGPVGSVNVTLTPSAADPDIYWNAVKSFHARSLNWTDSGAVVIAYFGATSFALSPFTLPDGTAEEALAIVQPWLDDMAALGANHTVGSFETPNFLQHIIRYFGPLPYGVWHGQVQTGRFVPKSIVANDLDSLITTYRNITDHGPYSFSLTGIDVSRTPRVADNAVNPKWRTLAHEMFAYAEWNYTTSGWQANLDLQTTINRYVDPELYRLMPDSGGYMNQGNPEAPTWMWKKDFYGVNYNRLRRVKQAYDPMDMFYATTAVGSDEWEVRDNGQLCRTFS